MEDYVVVFLLCSCWCVVFCSFVLLMYVLCVFVVLVPAVSLFCLI